MNLSINYLASVFNSTLRYMTPILLICLCAGVCSKARVFNIGLEGTLLMSAFFAFLTQYFTRNIYLAVLVGIITGMAGTFVIAFFIVQMNGEPMIVGMAVNKFAQGLTTFLLQMIFHTKGTVSDTSMNGLTKISIPGIKDIPCDQLFLLAKRNLELYERSSLLKCCWYLKFYKIPSGQYYEIKQNKFDVGVLLVLLDFFLTAI